MANSIFPWATTVETADATVTAVPLCRDCAWDYGTDAPILRGGAPVEVTGLEAVKVWAWQALKTTRYLQRIFTTDFGTDLPRLMGQGYSADTTTAEIKRYITETLTVSPYINSVTVENIALSGDDVTADVTLETIYGGATLNV